MVTLGCARLFSRNSERAAQPGRRKSPCYKERMTNAFPSHLTDDALVAAVKRLAGCERATTAQLVAHLAVMDERQLHLKAGFKSLFVYCLETLRLSEDAICNRLEVARAARKFPIILDRFADGSVTLTAVRLLAPHLTAENHEALLREAITAAGGVVFKLVGDAICVAAPMASECCCCTRCRATGRRSRGASSARAQSNPIALSARRS